jgi:hypothetical protein
MIDKTWLAIGLGAIVVPALAYGHYLQRSVHRAMYGREILDVLGEIADRPDTPANLPSKSSRGES